MPIRRRKDPYMDAAMEGHGSHFQIQLTGKRTSEDLYSSALPGANAWATTVSVDVAKSKTFHLFIQYDAAAAAGQWEIIPEIHTGGNGWFPMSVVPSSGTVVTRTAPTGLYTGENVDLRVYRAMVLTGPAATGASENQAMYISLNVEAAQEIRFHVREVGGGAVGTLVLTYTKST